MTVKHSKDARRVNFTIATLKKLPVPENGKQIYFADTECPGLHVSVGAGGRKTFVFRRKVNGVSPRKEIGRFPEMTIEQARGMVGELLNRIALGENPFDEGLTARDRRTLSELFDEYIEGHAKKRRKTWAVMEKDFARNAGVLKGKKLVHITQADARLLHTNLSAERGPYTANRTIQLLKAVFNYGIRKGLIDVNNPFLGVDMAPEEARERFLSDEEIPGLFAALDEVDSAEEDPRKRYLKDFILLCLFTGARKTNVLAMNFADIDLKHETWTIPGASTKTGTKYVIALGRAEVEILKRRQAVLHSGFVFPGEGGTGHIVEPKRAWTTVRKLAGIADITLHDLRRSLGAALAADNVNVALIKGALNHRDIKTTMKHYALSNKSAERKVKQALQDRWIASTSSPQQGNVVSIDTKRKAGKAE